MKEILEAYGATALGVVMAGAFVVLMRYFLYGAFREALILAADMVL